MRALSIESAIEQPSCSAQRFIGSSDVRRRGHRRHSSLCFVHPDRPRGVSRRSNLGDLLGDWLGAPSRRAVVGVAVRQLGPPSLRCCARRRHPPACNEGGNQWQSEAISGNQRQSPCMERDSALGISGNQRPSRAISGNQWPSRAISAHKKVISTHQKVISAHHAPAW